jgi:ABC-2 type transport system permease protein
MLTVFSKEVNVFLSSLIGYIVISIFLVANGLICWIFPNTNIFASGYADLETFFQFAPWIFLFLIPAITMRSIAEELEQGTLELLATKPIRDWEIVGGKYLATLFLILFSILPTIVYYFAISALASPKGNIDQGAIMGSYIGLFLLGACFASIGVFMSSLTKNQIVAFIGGVFACFLLYQSLEALALIPGLSGGMDKLLDSLSAGTRYRSVSQGLLDSRDILYFLSIVLFFLAATKTALSSRKW